MSKGTVCGVGITDIAVVDRNGKHRKSYTAWQSMLERCYRRKFHQRQPTYIDCSVAKEWHLFSVFEEWFDQNYHKGFQLDKDLLFTGNKVYSKHTCRYVPSQLNNLLSAKVGCAGTTPPGVTRAQSGRFMAKCAIPPNLSNGITNQQVHLGTYSTAEEAYQVFLNYKSQIIKDTALVYLNNNEIELDLYQSLIQLSNNLEEYYGK